MKTIIRLKNLLIQFVYNNITVAQLILSKTLHVKKIQSPDLKVNLMFTNMEVQDHTPLFHLHLINTTYMYIYALISSILIKEILYIDTDFSFICSKYIFNWDQDPERRS